MTEQGQATDQYDEDDVAPPLTLSQHYDNLILWMRGINPWWVVLTIVLVPFVFQTTGRLIYPHYPALGIPPGPKVDGLGDDVLVTILLVVFVSPLLETLAFQWLGTRVMTGILRANRFVTVLVLSILFSLAHWVVPIARLSILIVGFILTTFYFSRRFENGNAFYWVSGAHMLSNATLYAWFVIVVTQLSN